ncbi:hypothetical protein, partial [Escherichia coli]|uniref:hypothetical protein n=1 Tax=Escherichia coli TaxID=562 RepID=UPI0024BCC37E
MDKDTVLKMLNPACLKKADEWESPTCGEVRAVIGLTGMSGSQLAKKLGLKDSRNVRNWQMLKGVHIQIQHSVCSLGAAVLLR